MRRLTALALFAAVSCTTTVTPPPPPQTAPVVVQPYGFTLEEEATILRLEDRREFDRAVVDAWLHHPNPLHRARIALALGRIGSQTFIDTNDNGVRDAGEKQAGVDELASLVSDPSDPVRINAAFALGQIGDQAGADALVKFASDSDGTVAGEAVESLSRLAPALPLARYAPFAAASQREGVRARAIRFLFRFKSDEASALAIAALESPSPAIRKEGAYTLARRAYAPARERLELLLTDPEPLTRAYAASALGRIAAHESLAPLVTALADAHPWVRTNAVVAIGRLATKDAKLIERDEFTQDALKIVGLLEDPDAGVRASAVETLGWYAVKNEAARKRLLDVAANGSLWQREIAAGAIAKHFDDPKMLPAELTSWMKVRILESGGKVAEAMRATFAKDTDRLVRENAVGTIPDDQVASHIDMIHNAMWETDVIVRAKGYERFSKSKEPRVLQIMHAAEERGRFDQQNDVRVTAIDALASMEDPSREPFLRGLLKDNDPVARRMAADAIEKLGMPRPQFTPLPVTKTTADYINIVEWARKPHTASIHMTRGRIDIQLLPLDAPMTTWNFAQLAQKKYFNNTSFMRVVPNFVIQGGDPRNDQEGGPGYAIRDEINLQKYTRGAVGMALSGPDTGGSQFFITHSPQPHLDGGYTIFGRVSDGGIDIVDHTERGDKVETITIDEAPAP